MLLTVGTMIYGHLVIMVSGLWFIPGKEKYNIFTRWVSDFAAVSPQGLWIKGSIVLFCIALLIFKRAKRRACGNGVSWGWNAVLTFFLVAGLLLVILYDMSPPQYTLKQPSWLGKILDNPPVLVERRPDEVEYIKQWHHKLGFQMFMISFATTLLTTAVEKWLIKDVAGTRRDTFCLLLTAIFMLWLFTFHNSLAGIPQRVLLILIFWWVWREGSALPKPRPAI